MNENGKKIFKTIEENLYGSIENRDIFFKGIEIIEKEHKEFFKNKEFDKNELTPYIGFSNFNGKTVMDFSEEIDLPKEIKEKALVLFRKCFL
ncbi:hypothetical protein [uncultured Polaribacter sp.]|uniref:hypothetical protein n=1 Tax=uncultured Polaribacter sp. TaxID=174711 RepID=UPI0026343FCF|nr:hypothetical protein [uncultured Polaribacter sp.]